MTTSGTVGQTVVNTSLVLEHALRRCGLSAAAQTPEVVEIAKSCLFILLANYANSPLNLWCVESKLLGYIVGKKDYSLPKGSTAVLNLLHCKPNLVEGSLVDGEYTLTNIASITRVGLRFSSLPANDFTVEYSQDGLGFSNLFQVSLIADEVTSLASVYWFELETQTSVKVLRVSSGILQTVYACTSVLEIPVEPINRDTYASLPNKTALAEQPTGYLFNKLIDPTVTLWPVPSSEYMHAALWVHRQVQDVGRLTQKLAIPMRWYDATIIQLAFRLAMELPGVAVERIKLLQDLADKFTLDAANEETDSAPTQLQPRIGAYTK